MVYLMTSVVVKISTKRVKSPINFLFDYGK